MKGQLFRHIFQITKGIFTLHVFKEIPYRGLKGKAVMDVPVTEFKVQGLNTHLSDTGVADKVE